MQNQIQIFQGENNEIQVEVKFEEETVWLTQKQIIELFNSSKSNISEHITAIFESDELDEQSTVRNFRIVQKEGIRLVNREIIHYNLDVIISVGYRVNSKRGVQFRQWATQKLQGMLKKFTSFHTDLPSMLFDIFYHGMYTRRGLYGRHLF